jgi:hypothetical protein
MLEKEMNLPEVGEIRAENSRRPHLFIDMMEGGGQQDDASLCRIKPKPPFSQFSQPR